MGFLDARITEKKTRKHFDPHNFEKLLERRRSPNLSLYVLVKYYIT